MRKVKQSSNREIILPKSMGTFFGGFKLIVWVMTILETTSTFLSLNTTFISPGWIFVVTPIGV